MAGSLAHMVDEGGRLRMDLLENGRDMGQALEECFDVIGVLCGGDVALLQEALARLHYPDVAAAPTSEGIRRVLGGFEKNENHEWVEAELPWVGLGVGKDVMAEPPPPAPDESATLVVIMRGGHRILITYDSEEAAGKDVAAFIAEPVREMVGFLGGSPFATILGEEIVGFQVLGPVPTPAPAPPLANFQAEKPAPKPRRGAV